MARAWIENGVIRDVCYGDPVTSYHPDIAVLYDTDVPDDAQNGWVLSGGVWAAPAPHVPTAEEIAAQAAAEAAKVKADQIAVLKAQIAALEAAYPITPRLLRELTLIVRDIIPLVDPEQPPVYGLEAANQLNAVIVAKRAEIQAIQESP